MESVAEYLGDSVYVQMEDEFVMLTTTSHRSVEADNVIYLDPEVLEKLIKWLQDRRP